MKYYEKLVSGAVKMWFNTPDNPVPSAFIVDAVDREELEALKTVGFPPSPLQKRLADERLWAEAYALSVKKSPAEQL